MRFHNAIASFLKRLLRQMVQSLQYALDKWNSERTDWWIDVTSKKQKSSQFRNFHRFNLWYLKPVRIILSQPNLIILVCSKLQNQNVNLCTYKKSKSKFWLIFFSYSRCLMHIIYIEFKLHVQCSKTCKIWKRKYMHENSIPNVVVVTFSNLSVLPVAYYLVEVY